VLQFVKIVALRYGAFAENLSENSPFFLFWTENNEKKVPKMKNGTICENGCTLLFFILAFAVSLSEISLFAPFFNKEEPIKDDIPILNKRYKM